MKIRCKLFIFTVILCFCFVGCHPNGSEDFIDPDDTTNPSNPDTPSNPDEPDVSGNGILKDSYFWGKWSRMDNGIEYNITESYIKDSEENKTDIDTVADGFFTCSIGTFKKETDNTMLLNESIPIFRNGGSNIEYKVSLVGFVGGGRAATATTQALKGREVTNKTDDYPSYSEKKTSDDDGIVVLHSPVSGTKNTLQITASDGSVVTAVVAPKNSGENVGTIPVVPKGMYSLKVLGEVKSNDDKYGYLYVENEYDMAVEIQNISEVEAETSIVTMEAEDPSYITIGGKTTLNISTFPGGQSKELAISVKCNDTFDQGIRINNILF